MRSCRGCFETRRRRPRGPRAGRMGRAPRRAFEAALAERKAATRSRGWASPHGGSTSPISSSTRASAPIASITNRTIELAAARVAVWLAWDTSAFRGEARHRRRLVAARAPSARRPAAGRRTCVARRCARAYRHCFTTEAPKRRPRWPQRPSASARRSGRPATSVAGRALHGYAEITAGRVAEGLARARRSERVGAGGRGEGLRPDGTSRAAT